MPTIIKRCQCGHTDKAHNMHGCKIMWCQCEKYVYDISEAVEIDRRDNY